MAHQTELNCGRLRNGRQQRDEGLLELAEDIERVARLAYPDTDSSMLEVLGKDHFIDALLDDDARLRIRQMRPGTLRAALEESRVGGYKETPKWRKKNRTDITCRKCKKGYIQKNCPQRTVDEVSSVPVRGQGNLNMK